MQIEGLSRLPVAPHLPFKVPIKSVSRREHLHLRATVIPVLSQL